MSTKPEIEIRTASEVWPLADLELRADGKGLHFSGYAAVFDAPSQPLPFIETIRSGAFSKTLGEKRAKKLFLNHNTDIVLGSTSKGSLTLSEDKRGLLAEADLPDNEWGRPVADAIRRGDIDSMSFGFNKIEDKWSDNDNERVLIEVRLHEVSIVTGFPAYEDTSTSVRSGIPDLTAHGELRDAFEILLSPEDTLSEEQIEFLRASIESHRRTPRLAHWREEFARLVTPEPEAGALLGATTSRATT